MPPTSAAAASHLLPPIQRPPSSKPALPPVLPSSSPPSSSIQLLPVDSSPSASASSLSSTLSAARHGEIAIFGRSADPFNKDNWEDDFELDGPADSLADNTHANTNANNSTATITATARNSTRPAALAHANNSNSTADADDLDDWDEEIAREERTLSHSHNAANSTTAAADAIHTPTHAHRRSLPTLHLPKQPRDSPRMSHRPSPHQPPPLHVAGTGKERRDEEGLDGEEEEDWDKEIEDEAKQHSLRLSHKPTTPKPAVSFKGDISSSGHNHAASASSIQLKATLHRMLGMAEDEEEEEASVNGQTADDASSDSVGPTPSQSLLHLLTSASSSSHVNIVTYPPPSSLFSLRTAEGRREMTEKQLESWLRECVSKHKEAREKCTKVAVRFDEKAIAAGLSKGPEGLEAMLRDAICHINLLVHPFSLPVNHPAYASLTAAATASTSSSSASASVSSSFSSSPAASTAASAEGWSLLTKIFSSLASSTNSPALSPLLDTPRLYSLLYSLLFLSCKLWTQPRAKPFFSLIQTASNLLPSHTHSVELLEMECVAHHDGSRANKMLRIFVALFRKHWGGEVMDGTRSAYACECACQALTDVNFYMTNCSPLTAAVLEQSAAWDPEDASFAWLDRAWSGEAPTAEEGGDSEALVWRLCGHPSYRIELMRGMYERLEVGWVKARVAYVLGHASLVQSEEETDVQAGIEENREHHLRVAEKYLMECVYIIDQIPLITPHSPDLLSLPLLPVLSSLSSLALILYADTLLALSKYPYAILAFESAHLSYSLRCPPSSPTLHALNKRLTDICTQHDDLPRSLTYHRKLLEKAQQDGNLNMYVYIVQEVGRLEVVQGQMRRAEEHLRSALAVLKPYTSADRPANASPRRDDHEIGHRASAAGAHSGVGKFSVVGVSEVRSATINIFLQLARLYLDSERIVNAIVVLETLVRSDTLPRSKAGIVNLLLATAYMKRRRYKRAERILKTMEMAQGSAAAGGTGGAGKKGTMQMGGLSVAGGDILNSLDYLLLRTKCHYHAGDYTNALYWIDLSLSICSASSLSTLARLHYRKGKIYQAAIYASISPPDSRSESFFPPPLSPPFMANGCVMPDPRKAITSLYDAYHFYETIDDRVHMLKCLTRIVHIYTHITFTPVVLFHQQPASLVPWLAMAEFDVSGTTEPFAAFLVQVGELAEQTLASSLSTLALFPLLSSYLSLAEIRAMQGQHDASMQWWQTAKDTFFSLLVAGLHSVAICKTSPGWVGKVRTVLQRMVRLMMAGGGAGGGRGRWRRRRLEVLEMWIMWELEMGMEQRKGEEEDERDEAKKAAEASEAPVKEKEKEKDDKRKDKHSVQKLDMSLLHVFSHHSFDKEPASPSSPRPPSSSLSSSSSSALLRRRLPTSKDAWSEHRSVAFGALGSRSKNSSPAASTASTPTAASSALLAASPAPPPSSPVSLTLTPLDAAALKSISSLSDKIHASLYEMGRWRDQFAAGKLTQTQLYDRNHHAFNRMRAAMAAIRQINGSANTPSSRLSQLLPSNHTTADPLYSNLLYLFCLDGVCVCYSPKLSHTLLRLLLTPGGSPTLSSSRLSQLGGIFAPPAAANNAVVPSGPAVYFDRLVKEFYASAPTRASPLQSAADRVDGTSRLQPIEESKTAAESSPASASSSVSLSASASASVLTLPSAVDKAAAARDEACEACGCEWYVHHPHSDICKNCYHHHVPSSHAAFKRPLDEVKEESDTDSESEEEQVENSLFCPSDTASNRAWGAPAQYQVAVAADGRAERLDKDEEFDGEELNIEDVKLENSSPSKPSSIFSTLSSSSATVTPSPSQWSSSVSAHSSELDALLPPSLDIWAFQELFSSLDPQNILTVFSALFSESQLLFTSSSLFRLSSVTTSFTRLMYPFAWQHTYLPLLSATAVPLLSIHQPYIVGVHTSLLDPATIPALNAAQPAAILPSSPFSPVVVDCDRNSVRCSVGSFLHFPVKCKQRMYKHIVKFQSQMFLLQAEGGLTQEDRDGGRQLRQREQSVGGVGVTLPLGAEVQEGRTGGTSTTATSSASVIRSVSGGASRSDEERPTGAHPSSPSLLSVVPEERGEEDTEQRRKNAAAQWRKANAALRTLRDGFIAIFLSLFSNYPLFLTAPLASAPAAASTPLSSSATSSPPSALSRVPPSSSSSSSVAFPFDLPSFLYHAKPHYSSFLHAITRTRLFRQFILLRASPYMQQHRAQMRATLQTEREGAFVHWKDILHHPSVSANSAPSGASINATISSRTAAQPPTTGSSSYLFDDLCLRRLHARLAKLHDRERLDFHEAVAISRASGPFKKRWLVLEGSRLRIYGSRRVWEKKGGGEVKYERRVGRGVARVGVGTADGDGKREWELIGGVEYDGGGKEKGDGSWHVRSETEESKKRWVKLLQARCMTDEMRKQWEAVV